MNDTPLKTKISLRVREITQVIPTNVELVHTSNGFDAMIEFPAVCNASKLNDVLKHFGGCNDEITHEGIVYALGDGDDMGAITQVSPRPITFCLWVRDASKIGSAIQIETPRQHETRCFYIANHHGCYFAIPVGEKMRILDIRLLVGCAAFNRQEEMLHYLGITPDECVPYQVSIVDGDERVLDPRTGKYIYYSEQQRNCDLNEFIAEYCE